MLLGGLIRMYVCMYVKFNQQCTSRVQSKPTKKKEHNSSKNNKSIKKRNENKNEKES